MRLCIHASILLTVFFLQEASLTHAGTLLLKNGIFHTMSHQPVVKGDLLIQNQKIAMIADRITSPADAIMDLEEAHVYPGMIAMTTTLGLLEINSVRATLDTTEVGQWTPEVLSWRAVNPSSELLPVARANGITHAQPIPLGGTLSGQSGLLQLDGWTLEDMLVKPSVGYHLFWPSAAIQHTPKALMAQPSNWKNPKDQKTAHRKKVEAITEFLASSKAYVQGLRSNETLSPIPSWEAMIAWVEGQEPLFIHASEHRQIQSVLDWVETNASKVVLVGGRDAWKSAHRLADLKVPVVYEHTFTLPQDDTASYDVQFTAPSILYRAGVKVIFSEGSNRFAASAVRNLPYAAAQAAAFGLPEDEAMKGITRYPAEVLGMGHRIGSLKTGMEASLVTLNGPLLDIRSQVTHMWIKGKPVSLESRHTRLYEKYRKRPKVPER